MIALRDPPFSLRFKVERAPFPPFRTLWVVNDVLLPDFINFVLSVTVWPEPSCLSSLQVAQVAELVFETAVPDSKVLEMESIRRYGKPNTDLYFKFSITGPDSITPLTMALIYVPLSEALGFPKRGKCTNYIAISVNS